MDNEELQQLETTAQLNLEANDNISKTVKSVTETINAYQLKLFLADGALKGLNYTTTKYRDVSIAFAKQTTGNTNAITAQTKALTQLSGTLTTFAKWTTEANKVMNNAWTGTAIAGSLEKIYSGAKAANRELQQIPRTLALMERSGTFTGVIEEAKQLWEIMKLNQDVTESFVNSAVSRYVQLEKSITLVNTILGLTAVGIKGTIEDEKDLTAAKEGLTSEVAAGTEALKRYDEALKASKKSAIDYSHTVQSLVDNELKNAVSSVDALNASYQALSSGYVNAAESQAVMTTGLKLAYAGAADASTTMKALTQSMQAYKIAANDSAKVANVLLQTVNLGITTLPELAGGFAQTAVVAKEAGVRIEELGGAVAALTLKGNNTATALTGLEALFRNIISKTPEATKALEQLRDAQGKAIRFDIAEVKAKGLTKSLQDLSVALNGNSQMMANILPDSLAFSSALALMADNAKELKKNTEQIVETGKKASQYLEKAFDIKLGDKAAKFEQIVNRFTETLVKFGESLAPAFDKGLTALESTANFFNKIPIGVREAIAQLALGTLVVKSTTSAFMELAKGVTSAFLSFQAFRLIQMLFKGELPGLINTIGDLYKAELGFIPIIKQIIGLDQKHLLIEKEQNIVRRNRFEIIQDLQKQQKGWIPQLKQLIGINQEEQLEISKGTEALRKRGAEIEKYATTSNLYKEIEQKAKAAEEQLKNLAKVKEALVKDEDSKKTVLKEVKTVELTESIELTKLQREKADPDKIEAQAKKVVAANKEVLASEKALDSTREYIKKNEDNTRKAEADYATKKEAADKINAKLTEAKEKVAERYINAEKLATEAARKKAEVLEANNLLEEAREAIKKSSTNTTTASNLVTQLSASVLKKEEEASNLSTAATNARIVAKKFDIATTQELLIAEGKLLKTSFLWKDVVLPNNWFVRAANTDVKVFTSLISKAVGKVAEFTKGLVVAGSTKLLQALEFTAVKAIALGVALKANLVTIVATTNALIVQHGVWKGITLSVTEQAKNLIPAITKSFGFIKTALAGAGVGATGFAATIPVIGAAILFLADNFIGFGKTAKEALKESIESTKQLKTGLREVNSELYSLAENQKVQKGGWKGIWEFATSGLKGFGNTVKEAAKGFWLLNGILKTVEATTKNYKFNQIIESLSNASNATELAGVAWVKAAEKNQLYVKGLYSSVELNKKVHQGLTITIADLQQESKAFQANKKERDVIIKDNENQLKSLQKLREGVKDPNSEIAQTLDNRIEIVEKHLEKLKEAGAKQQELYDLLIKFTPDRNKLLQRKSLWDNQVITDEELNSAKKNADDSARKLGEVFNETYKKIDTSGKNKITQIDLQELFKPPTEDGKDRNSIFGEKIAQAEKELKDAEDRIKQKQKENKNIDKDVKEFQEKQKALQQLTKEFQIYNAMESEYLEKRNKKELTKPEDIGFNSMDTALKKSIRFSEEALANYFAKLAAVRDGLDKYVDPVSKEEIALSKEGIAELEGGADKLLSKLDSNLADIETRFAEGYLNGADAAQQVEKILEMEVESVDKAGKRVKQKLKEFLDPKDIIPIVQKQFEYITEASTKEINRQKDFVSQYKVLQDAKLISTQQALLGINKAEQEAAAQAVNAQKEILEKLERNKAGSLEQIEAAKRKLDILVGEYQALAYRSNISILNNEKDATVKAIQFKQDLYKVYEQGRRVDSITAIKEIGKAELEEVKTNYAAILKEYEAAKENNLSGEEITTLGRQLVIAKEIIVNKQFELEENLINKTAQLERESLDRRLKMYRGFIDAKQLTTKEATKKINELEKKQLENDLKEIDKKIALAEKGITPDVANVEMSAKEIDNLAKPQLEELQNISTILEKISGQIANPNKPELKTAINYPEEGHNFVPTQTSLEAEFSKFALLDNVYWENKIQTQQEAVAQLQRDTAAANKTELENNEKFVQTRNDVTQKLLGDIKNIPIPEVTTSLQEKLDNAHNNAVNNLVGQVNTIPTQVIPNKEKDFSQQADNIVQQVKAIPTPQLGTSLQDKLETQQGAAVQTLSGQVAAMPPQVIPNKEKEFYQQGAGLVQQVQQINPEAKETTAVVTEKELSLVDKVVTKIGEFFIGKASASEVPAIPVAPLAPVTQSATRIGELKDEREIKRAAIQTKNIEDIKENADANIYAPKRILTDSKELLDNNSGAKLLDPVAALQQSKEISLGIADLEIKAQQDKLAEFKKLGDKFNQESLAEEERTLEKLTTQRKQIELTADESIKQERLRIQQSIADNTLAINQNLLSARKTGELESLQVSNKVEQERAQNELKAAEDSLAYLKSKGKSQAVIAEAARAVALAQSNLDRVSAENNEKYIEKNKEVKIKDVSFLSSLAKSFEEGKRKDAIETNRIETKAAQATISAEREALEKRLGNKNLGAEQRKLLEKELADLNNRSTTQVIQSKEKEVNILNSLDKERAVNQKTITRQLADAQTMSVAESTKKINDLNKKEFGADLTAINRKLQIATNEKTKQSPEEITRLKEQRDIIITSQQAQNVKAISEQANANIATPKSIIADTKELIDLRIKAKEIDPVAATEKTTELAVKNINLEILAQEDKIKQFTALGEKFSKESMDEEKRNLEKLVAQREDIELSGEESIRQARIQLQKDTASNVLSINQNLWEARQVGELEYLKKTSPLLITQAKQEVTNAKEYMDSLIAKGKDEKAIAEARRAYTLAQSNLEKVNSETSVNYIEKNKEVQLNSLSFLSGLAKTFQEGKQKSALETARIEQKATLGSLEVEKNAIKQRLTNAKLSAEERKKLNLQLADLNARTGTQKIVGKEKEIDITTGTQKASIQTAKEVTKQVVDSKGLSASESVAKLNSLTVKELSTDLDNINKKITSANAEGTKQSAEQVKSLKQQRDIILANQQAQKVRGVSEQADANIAARKRELADTKELLDLRIKAKQVDPLLAIKQSTNASVESINLEINAQKDKIAGFTALGDKFSKENMDAEKRNLQKLVAQRKEIELSGADTLREERLRINREATEAILVQEQNLLDAKQIGEKEYLTRTNPLLIQRAKDEVNAAKESLTLAKARGQDEKTIAAATRRFTVAQTNLEKVTYETREKTRENSKNTELRNLNFLTAFNNSFQEGKRKSILETAKIETSVAEKTLLADKNYLKDQLNNRNLSKEERKKINQQIADIDNKLVTQKITGKEKQIDLGTNLDKDRLKNRRDILSQQASAKSITNKDAVAQINKFNIQDLDKDLAAIDAKLKVATDKTTKQSAEAIGILKQQRDVILTNKQAQVVKNIRETADASIENAKKTLADNRELIDTKVKAKDIDPQGALAATKKANIESINLDIQAQEKKIKDFKALGNKFSKEAMDEEKRNLAKLVAQRREIELSSDEAIRQERLRRNQETLDSLLVQQQNYLDTRQLSEVDFLKKVAPLALQKAKDEAAAAKADLDNLVKNGKSKVAIAEAQRKYNAALSNVDKVDYDNRNKLTEANKNQSLKGISFLTGLAKTFEDGKRKSAIETARIEAKAAQDTIAANRKAIEQQLKENKLAPKERANLLKELNILNSQSVTETINAKQKEVAITTGLEKEKLSTQKTIYKQLADSRALSIKEATKQAAVLETKELNTDLSAVNKSIKDAENKNTKQSPEEIARLKQQRDVILTNIQAANVRRIAEEAEANIADRKKAIGDRKEVIGLQSKTKSIDSIAALTEDKKLSIESANLQIKAQEDKITKFKALGKKFSKEAMEEEKRSLEKLVAQRDEIEMSADEAIRQERLRRNQTLIDTLIAQEQNLVDTRRVGELEFLNKINPLLVKKAEQEVTNAKKSLDYLRANNKSKADIDEADQKYRLAQSNLEKTIVDNRFKLLDASKNKELENINFLSSAAKTYAEGRRKSSIETAQMESEAARKTLEVEKKYIEEQLKDNKLSVERRTYFTKQLADVNNRAVTANITAKEKEANILISLERERIDVQKSMLKELTDARAFSTVDAVKKALALEVKDLELSLREIDDKIKKAKADGQSKEYIGQLQGQRGVITSRMQSTTVRGIREKADAGVYADKKKVEDEKELLSVQSKAKEVDTITATEKDTQYNLQNINLQIRAQQKKLAEFKKLGTNFNKEAYEEEQRALKKLVAQRGEIQLSGDEAIRQERLRRNLDITNNLLSQEQNLLDTRRISEKEFLDKTSPLQITRAKQERDNAKATLDYLKKNNKDKQSIAEAERAYTLSQSNVEKVTVETRLKNIDAVKNKTLTDINFLSNATKIYAEGRRKNSLDIAKAESYTAQATLKADKDSIVEQLKDRKLSADRRKILLKELTEIENKIITENINARRKEVDILTGLDKERIRSRKELVKELADSKTLTTKEAVQQNIDLELRDLDVDLKDVNKKLKDARATATKQSPEEIAALERQRKIILQRTQSTKVRGISEKADAEVAGDRKRIEDTRELIDLGSKSKEVDSVKAIQETTKLNADNISLQIKAQQKKISEFTALGKKYNQESLAEDKRYLNKLVLQRKEIELTGEEQVRQERLRRNLDITNNLLAQEQNLLDTRRVSEKEFLDKTIPLQISRAKQERDNAKATLDYLKKNGKDKQSIAEAERSYTLSISNVEKVTTESRLKNIDAIKNKELQNIGFLSSAARTYAEGKRKSALEIAKMEGFAAQATLKAEKESILAQLKDRQLSGERRKTLLKELADVENRTITENITARRKEVDILTSLDKERIRSRKELVKELTDSKTLTTKDAVKQTIDLELKDLNADLKDIDKKLRDAKAKPTKQSQEEIDSLERQRKLTLQRMQSTKVRGISDTADANIAADKKRLDDNRELVDLRNKAKEADPIISIQQNTKLSVDSIGLQIKAQQDKITKFTALGKKYNQESLAEDRRYLDKLVLQRKEIELSGEEQVRQERLRRNQDVINTLISKEQNLADAKQLNEKDFLNKTNPLLVKRAEQELKDAESSLASLKKKNKDRSAIYEAQRKVTLAQSNLEKTNYEVSAKNIEANKNRGLRAINFLTELNKTYEEGKRKGTLETAKVEGKAALDSLEVEKNAVKKSLDNSKLAPEERKKLLKELTVLESKTTTQVILNKQKEIGILASLDKERLASQKDITKSLIDSQVYTVAEAARKVREQNLKDIDLDIALVDKKIKEATKKGTEQSKEELERLQRQRAGLVAGRGAAVVGGIKDQAEADVRAAKKRLEDLRNLSQTQVGSKDKTEAEGAAEQAKLSIQIINKDIEASNKRLKDFKALGKKFNKEGYDEELRTFTLLQAQKKQVALEAVQKRVAAIYEIENRQLQNSLDIYSSYRQAGIVADLEAAKQINANRAKLLDNSIKEQEAYIKELEKRGVSPKVIQQEKDKYKKLQADRKVLSVDSAKEEFRIEQDYTNRVINLKREAYVALNDSRIKSNLETANLSNQLEEQALKQELKNKEANYKQIVKLNPNNKKAIEEAGLEVAVVRNKLAFQEIKSLRNVGEARLKDLQTQTDLELNQIKLTKITKNLYEEDEFRLSMANRLKSNKAEQDYIRGQIDRAKKRGEYTLELEKELSGKMVEEVSLRNEKIAKEYERQRAILENIEQRSLLGLTKQSNVLEIYTKQLQLEQTLRETNKTLIEAVNNANISALERESKLQKDIVEKADLDLKISQAQYKNRIVSLELDKEGLKVREAETRLSIEKQQLDLKRNESETKRSIIDKKNEIDLENRATRDKQKLEKLEIELGYLREREEMNKKEAVYLEDNKKVSEKTIENNRKALELSQAEERKNARVEVRLAVINKIVVQYEKLIKTQEIASSRESNSANVTLAINEKLNKAYQVRTELLEKQKAIVNNRDNFAQEQFKFAQGLTNNEYLKIRLAKESALINLQTMDKRQAGEAAVLELQIKQNKLALERQKLEQKFNELRAEREEKIAGLRYQQSLVNGTPEDQEQARLALEEKITNRVLTLSNRENIANQEVLDNLQNTSSRTEQSQKFYTERQQGVAVYQQATGSPSLAIAMIRQAIANGYANTSPREQGRNYIGEQLRQQPFVVDTPGLDAKLADSPAIDIEKSIKERKDIWEKQTNVQAIKDKSVINEKVEEAVTKLADSITTLSKSIADTFGKTIQPPGKETEKTPVAMKMASWSVVETPKTNAWQVEKLPATDAYSEVNTSFVTKIELKNINTTLQSIKNLLSSYIRRADKTELSTKKETEKTPLKMKMASWSIAEPAKTNSVSGANRTNRLNTINKDIESFKESQDKVIAFVGDSITAAGRKTNSLLSGKKVLNLGVSGDRTDQIANRLPAHLKKLDKSPNDVVLLAGINDLRQGKSLDSIVSNIKNLVTTLKKENPNSRVILESLLPTRLNNIPTTKIVELNNRLKKVAESKGATFVDLVPHFKDKEGKLKKEYTTDGLHLSKQGYEKLGQVVKSAIENKTIEKRPKTSAYSLEVFPKTTAYQLERRPKIQAYSLEKRPITKAYNLETRPKTKAYELEKRPKTSSYALEQRPIIKPYNLETRPKTKAYNLETNKLAAYNINKQGKTDAYVVDKFPVAKKAVPTKKTSLADNLVKSATKTLPVPTKPKVEVKGVELELKTTNSYLAQIRDAIIKDKDSISLSSKSTIAESPTKAKAAGNTKIEKHYHIKIEAPITNKIEGAANPKDFGDRVGKQIFGTLDDLLRDTDRRMG